MMLPLGRLLPHKSLTPTLQHQESPEMWGIIPHATLMVFPPAPDHVQVIEVPDIGILSQDTLLKRAL